MCDLQRRIARARAERDLAAPTPSAVLAEAGARGNGGLPRWKRSLSFGRRYTQELAEALGEDARQVRRWFSGEAVVPPRSLAWARDAARRRARDIVRLVGER